jgi:hypothetical protein
MLIDLFPQTLVSNTLISCSLKCITLLIRNKKGSLLLQDKTNEYLIYAVCENTHMRIVYTVYYKFKTFCDSFYKNISHVIRPTGNNPIRIVLSHLAKENPFRVHPFL